MLQDNPRTSLPQDFQDKGWFSSRILDSKGCLTLSISYPRNGLKEKPDLLILDLNFSQANVLGMLQRIREDKPSLPVIICSDSVAEQFKNQVLWIQTSDCPMGGSVFFRKQDVIRRPRVCVEQIRDRMKKLSLTIRKRDSLPLL